MATEDKQKTEMVDAPGRAEGRYAALQPFREPYLKRARECAELTIPALMPPEGFDGNQDLYTPFQSIGSRGVNNLSSKLLLTLFPANSAFMRMSVDDATAEQMSQDKDVKTKVEKSLVKYEKRMVSQIETSGWRHPAFQSIKQLLVAGNVLLHLTEETKLRVFRLDRFVVKRDPMGNVLEIVVKEDVSHSVLESEYPDLYEEIEPKLDKDAKTCALFTHVKRSKTHWKVYQEVKGQIVPESQGSYPMDNCPWLPLSPIRLEGEDYGRSYVEEYLGDLKSLEALMQAIVEGSAAAAKVLFFVNPNGVTKKDVVAKAPNGSVREGRKEDVSTLQLEKFNDFRVAQETVRDLTQRLSMAFLLQTSVQRSGERVTAEEIRYMAGELEDALGGIYTLLSQEWQLPLARLLMWRMTKTGKLPRLPRGTVKMMIVTGLEALGRGHDLKKLDAFVAGAQQTIGPELLGQNLNVANYLDRRANALGIDTDGLIPTAEEIAARQQQASMESLVSKLGPDVLKLVGKQAENTSGSEAPAAQ